MKSRTEAYKILGITTSATSKEIKAAYYKLAKEKHPDLDPKNLERFKAINEAYTYLSKNPLPAQTYQDQQDEYIWKTEWKGFQKEREQEILEKEIKKQKLKKKLRPYQPLESNWIEMLVIAGFLGLIGFRIWFQVKTSSDQAKANQKLMEDIENEKREDQRLFELYESNLKR